MKAALIAICVFLALALLNSALTHRKGIDPDADLLAEQLPSAKPAGAPAVAPHPSNALVPHWQK